MKNLSYFVISDLHLGSIRNKTKTLIENLENYFKHNDDLLKTIDILFIAGDVFDRSLNHSSDEVIDIIAWMSRLANWCFCNNVKLRILEGTPSHDWNQCKAFDTAISRLNIHIDFKYIDNLYIETMHDLDFTILYIPDCWKPNIDDVFIDAKKELINNNIKKVDIGIFHGYFEHQLPKMMVKGAFKVDDYTQIIKHYIHVGHIHTPSFRPPILAQGSADRLAHNEEERKGGVYVKFNKDMPKYKFIVNEFANIYKTIRIKSEDINEVLTYLDSVLNKLHKSSFIKILMKKNNPINNSKRDIRLRYIDHRLDFDFIDKKELVSLKHELKSIGINNTDIKHIDNKNIIALLTDRMEKYQLNPNELITMNKILEDVI